MYSILYVSDDKDIMSGEDIKKICVSWFNSSWTNSKWIFWSKEFRYAFKSPVIVEDEDGENR